MSPACEEKCLKFHLWEKGIRAIEVLELIHTHVCGPINHIARGDFYNFITFTDDYSRYDYLYLMKHKSESFEKVQGIS